MNRSASRGSRTNSYQFEDVKEACRRVQKNELSIEEAVKQYGIPRSTFLCNLKKMWKYSKQHKDKNVDKNRKTKSKEKNGHKMSAETSKNVKGLCCFCNVGHEQELQLGKLYTFNNISVHYYCLLFSSGLPQNGDDDEGIMGFLPQDIEKEIQRGRKLTCCYCFKRGATVGCSTKKCRRTYHYLCGLEHYAIGKFANDFRSYCVDHRDYQQGNGIGKKVECPICMEELRADPKTAVWAPCCKRNSWFHKLCLQKLALSAGYFFKCPLCNDKDTFLQEMQNVGIFVPEKDASWELEPNAFSDLLERPIHCDAPKCKCPDGRKSDEDGTRWEILLCNLCGSTGVHIACGGLPFTCVHWTCPVCADMVADSVKRMQQEDRDRRLKERNFKLKHDSQESTSYEKPSSSNQNMVVDVGDRDRTPYKRKLDVLNRIEKTPLKLNVSDNSTVLKITYESDSDNEIDIESGEYQISPHTIIRELEEHGEELPIQLRKLKGFAVQAQKRMLELRLTEADMVKMAKESPQYKSFCLDKSDITRFYRYSLPLEKMLQIVPIIKVIFAIREAVVKEAQSSSSKKQKRAKSLTPNSGRKGRNPDPRTPKIKIPLLKSALAQTLIASGKSSRAVGQCKMEEIGDSTSSDGCSMQSAQHFIKTEQSSFLDHSNVMSKVHKNLKDGVSETVFCISSNSAITDAASTLSPKSLKSSEEPSEISNTKLTVPVFPLQSDKFSASNEVKQDQDKVDKKNENRKNNTRITGINQETQTSGACRKLSLQFSASTENLDDCHFSSPSMFISLNSSARYENVLAQRPLLAATNIKELCSSSDVELVKSTNKKLTDVDDIPATPLDEKMEQRVLGVNLVMRENHKLRQTVLMPFKPDNMLNIEPTKAKKVKSQSLDKIKYVQKTLSPFILKKAS